MSLVCNFVWESYEVGINKNIPGTTFNSLGKCIRQHMQSERGSIYNRQVDACVELLEPTQVKLLDNHFLIMITDKICIHNKRELKEAHRNTLMAAINLWSIFCCVH